MFKIFEFIIRSEENTCILEVNFLRANGRHILKELAYIIVETGESSVYAFRPPFPYHELSLLDRRQCAWISRSICGLDWNEGDYAITDLDFIIPSILSKAGSFYTKGVEKSSFLSELFGVNIVNIESLGCPKFSRLSNECPLHCKYHADNSSCALIKAYKIKLWKMQI